MLTENLFKYDDLVCQAKEELLLFERYKQKHQLPTVRLHWRVTNVCVNKFWLTNAIYAHWAPIDLSSFARQSVQLSL